MLILAVDTCLPACTAVVSDDGRVIAARSEPMLKGHQERLAPMVAEVMAEAGLTFSGLARTAATIGPGSFTGLRVGLAFARAMAGALAIPCAGIGTLEALAHGQKGRVLVLVDARRGQAYWQGFDNGAPITEPAISPLETILAWRASNQPTAAVGPGSSLILDPPALPIIAPSPQALAALAARDPVTPPNPLYLRAPDAKLPGGRELVL